MRPILLLVLFCSGVMLTSCVKRLSYFTEDLYNDSRWTDNELKKIQFYVSEDIVLVRDLGNEASVIENGEIKIREGKRVEEVVIRAGTPGVFVFSPKVDRLAISFDEGDDNYLMFGPNDKANGRFVLLAKEWRKRGGVVTYGGKTYRTSSQSAYAALMVNIKKARKVKYSKETASGRKVR